MLSTALLLGLTWSCSASNDPGVPSHPGAGGTPSIGEAGTDAQIKRLDGSAEAGESSLGLDPLCGKAPRCVPDQPGACSSYVPPAPPSDDASVDSAAIAQAGAPGNASGTAESSSSASGAGGATDAAGGATDAAGGATDLAGGSAEGGGNSAAGAPGASAGASGAVGLAIRQFSCQLQRTADAADAVVAGCGLAGPGQVNSPCLTSSDCGWDTQGGALGCVGDESAGLCEPYCCKGDDTCAQGTYCAERSLRDALTNLTGADGVAPAVMIPVCVPAENCDLSTPYPCPAKTECTCAAGTACLVVRADGTTTCAVPGAGKAGDACPCAWGHVCSVATNQCLELCYTRGAETCGDGACQSSAELPEGWGVCVGATLPSGR